MQAKTDSKETERLLAAGAHFGQVRSRRHPSMKPFLVGAKSRTEIIDLAKTEDQLMAAKQVMETLAKDGKIVLFVGGKPEIAPLVRDAASKISQPYVATRWLGGTISNWQEIKKRVERLASLTEGRASGALAKQHTKLELVRLDREEKRLTTRLDGIAELAKKPDALLVVDTKQEKLAVKEARDAGIPIIAIMGSDNNLADAVYPIVANDSSRETVKLLLGELVEAFQKGRAA